MGVFSLFRRKVDAAVAQPTEEAAAATVTPDPEAKGADDAPADCCAAAEASGRTEAGAEPEAGDAPAESAAGAEGAAAEGVEIPKQQSAEEAADNEAGEGARK
ncbi:hypothetical protein ACGFW5_08580 [Streptomyces sp. NPDC048416]|uniref:hypothetical protein n=1 Tax=Streptomyces sp. NPDC048416 TaxID=3365546 RepID=UPI003724526B